MALWANHGTCSNLDIQIRILEQEMDIPAPARHPIVQAAAYTQKNTR